MKYGCNYSHELMELIKEDTKLCDYIKIGAFGITERHMDDAYKLKPLLIHGFGWFERGGMSLAEDLDYHYMNDMLRKYGSPYIGMHALAYDKDVLFCNNIYTLMKENFTHIASNLTVGLTIENMDYSPYYTYDSTVIETVMPEFLNDLVHETNCLMLFDLSHARVSAYQLGMTIYNYIDLLPLERIKEIHFSGSYFSKKEGFMDIHGIMNEDDYDVARYIAKHKRVVEAEILEIITLEYGTAMQGHTSKKAIKEQLERLKLIFD